MEYKPAGFVLLVILIVLVSALGQTGSAANGSAELQLISGLLGSGYDPRIRPTTADQGPVVITVHFSLYSVLGVDERQQTFTATSFVQLTWRDSLLSWNPDDHDNITEIVLPSEDVWTPSFQILNLASASDDPFQSGTNTYCYIRYTGHVDLADTIIHTTFCPLVLVDFPFDTHDCDIIFTTQNDPNTRVQWASGNLTVFIIAQNAEWDVNGVSDIIDNENVVYPVFYMRVNLSRLGIFYVRNIMLPIVLVNILAVVSFVIPLHCGERISACISLVLGLTIFQIVITDIMPRTSRRSEEPVLVEYAISSFALLSAIAISAIITTNIHYSKGKVRSKVMRAILFDFLGRLTLVVPLRCLLKRGEVANEEQIEDTSKGSGSKAQGQDEQPSDMEMLATIVDRLLFVFFLVIEIILLLQSPTLVQGLRSM